MSELSLLGNLLPNFSYISQPAVASQSWFLIFNQQINALQQKIKKLELKLKNAEKTNQENKYFIIKLTEDYEHALEQINSAVMPSCTNNYPMDNFKKNKSKKRFNDKQVKN
ncbi:MAG: hypothetical protein JWM09_811 [Francisellaceae bacterium]|nr:hypothetical protein [Francisellaceae bacterium]